MDDSKPLSTSMSTTTAALDHIHAEWLWWVFPCTSHVW
jgi:hypothetical protein